jgi:hypothetical protein
MSLIQCDQASVQVKNLIIEAEKLVPIVALSPRKRLYIVEVLSEFLHFEPWDHTFGQMNSYCLEVKPRVNYRT